MTAHIVTRQRAAIARLADEIQIARDALEVIATQGGRVGLAASMALSAMDNVDSSDLEAA